MTALINDRSTPQLAVKAFGLPVAVGTPICFKGARACIDTTTGLCVPGKASTTLVPVGLFAERIDNRTGAQTVLAQVSLDREILLRWYANDGTVTAAALLQDCYILDDQTVTMNATGASKSGRIWQVDPFKGVAVETGAATSSAGASSFTSQAIWYFDPQKTVSGASDANDGLTPATPIVKYSELVRRWGGTTSPNLRQSTRLVFLSSHTDDSDPVVWTPLMSNAATASIESVPTVVATGVVLSAVVAKNTAAGTNSLLAANLGASGSLNVLVKNTTAGKSSICPVYQLVAGTTWKLYQPVVPTSVGGAYNPPQVNTWANGDTVDILQPQAINLVKFDPEIDIMNTTFTSWGHLYQVTSFCPLDASYSVVQRLQLGQNVRVMESVMQRALYFIGRGSGTASPFLTTVLTNVACLRSIDGAVGAPVTFYGGGNNSASASNLGVFSLQGGFQSNCTISSWGNGSTLGDQVWLERPLFIDGEMNVFAAGIVYGPSEVRLQATARLSIDPAATWTGTFTGPLAIASGILMNGGRTASSVVPGSPSVINGGIATTVANLDAAAGAAGFGGAAFNLGGASLAKAA